MAHDSGRPADQVVEEALAGYFAELDQTREMLDSRYDDLDSGKVELIDGEEFFEALRMREEEMKKLTPR